MFTLHQARQDREPTLVSSHRTLKAAELAMKKLESSDSPDLKHWEKPHRFIVKPTTLVTGTGRLTHAYWLVKAAATRAGTTVTKRQKGFSDFGDLMSLTNEGLLEIRFNGPRGGKTWHATNKGRRALANYDSTVSRAS